MHIYLPIAETSLNIPLIILIGAAIGFLSGLFGIGGGFLITPILIFLNVPAAIAIGTSANQAIGSATISTLNHFKNRSLDIKLALILIITGLLGSYLGVLVFKWLRLIGQLDLIVHFLYVFLLGGIGLTMLVEGLLTIYKKAPKEQSTCEKTPNLENNRFIDKFPLKIYFREAGMSISFIPLAIIGIIVGFLSSILGIGGGFLTIPLLTYLIRVPPRFVIGTSIFQVACVSIFTTLLQASINHAVDIVLACFLMIGGILGAKQGTKLSFRLQPERLRIFLAILILSIVSQLALKLFKTPAQPFHIDLLPYENNISS